MRNNFARLLLVTMFAALAFGGSFTCRNTDQHNNAEIPPTRR